MKHSRADVRCSGVNRRNHSEAVRCGSPDVGDVLRASLRRVVYHLECTVHVLNNRHVRRRVRQPADPQAEALSAIRDGIALEMDVNCSDA